MPVRCQVVEGETVAVEDVVRCLVEAPGISDEASLHRVPGFSGGEDPVDEVPAGKPRPLRAGEHLDHRWRQKLDAERLRCSAHGVRIARLRRRSSEKVGTVENRCLGARFEESPELACERAADERVSSVKHDGIPLYLGRDLSESFELAYRARPSGGSELNVLEAISSKRQANQATTQCIRDDEDGRRPRIPKCRCRMLDERPVCDRHQLARRDRLRSGGLGETVEQEDHAVRGLHD